MDAEYQIVTVPVPATPDSPGELGHRAEDYTYVYICMAPNAWVRIPKAAW
jgi:hypothetical protein